MKLRFPLLITFLSCLTSFAGEATLEPKMVQLDKLILSEDFTDSRSLDKDHWKPRQHTRWAIEDGVLRGIPSTAEFQASQDHHQGLEPRLSIPSCPREFAIQFSLRMVAGTATPICPFVEFGHHMGRIRWGDDGANLLANGESVELDHHSGFKLESGTWYHGLAEIKGDEVLIRFDHGPILYGKHPSLDGKKDGFGVAGFKGGKVELDNIKVWSVKPRVAEGWKDTVRGLKPMAHKILNPEKVKG